MYTEAKIKSKKQRIIEHRNFMNKEKLKQLAKERLEETLKILLNKKPRNIVNNIIL